MDEQCWPDDVLESLDGASFYKQEGLPEGDPVSFEPRVLAEQEAKDFRQSVH